MNFAIKRGYVVGADPLRGVENPKPYRPAPVNAATDTELLALLRELDPDGHPNSPTHGHLKFPHPDRASMRR